MVSLSSTLSDSSMVASASTSCASLSCLRLRRVAVADMSAASRPARLRASPGPGERYVSSGPPSRCICMRRVAAACVVAIALVCAPAAGAVSLHDADGIHIPSVKQVNPRLLAIAGTTKALPRPINIYVLLPPDYDAQPKRRWPVFYLL